MDWGAVVIAGLGIAGTVAGSATSPFLAARLARRERRAAIYTDALAALWTIHDNAQTLSSIPAAEMARPSADQLRHIDAEVRLIGGRRVRDQLHRAVTLADRFDRELFLPQVRARAQMSELGTDAEDSGDMTPEIDGRRAIQQGAEEVRAMGDRLALGKIADELGRAITELEERMRVEVSPLGARRWRSASDRE